MRTILNKGKPAPYGLQASLIPPGIAFLEQAVSTAIPTDPVAQLYSAHHGWLRAWLVKKLGCSFDASDLAQDTFMRIVASYQRGTAADVREPRAYLRTVANGLIVDLFRRRSLEQAYLDALACMPEATTASPEERMLILETLHSLDAMLDTLPAKVRTVFLMSQLEGLTYADIGTRLGMSLRTVKRHMQLGFAQCLSLML